MIHRLTISHRRAVEAKIPTLTTKMKVSPILIVSIFHFANCETVPDSELEDEADVYCNTYAVQLRKDSNPDDLAQSLGLANEGEAIPGFFEFRDVSNPETSRLKNERMENVLRANPAVKMAAQQVMQWREVKNEFELNDPL